MSEEGYARVMRRLAEVLGVRWEGDADTHELINAAGRAAERAGKFQQLARSVEEALERNKPRGG